MSRFLLLFVCCVAIGVGCTDGPDGPVAADHGVMDSVTFRAELDTVRRMIARGSLDEAASLARTIEAKAQGDPALRKQQAGALTNLGIIQQRRAQPDSALAHYQEALQVAEQLGDTALIGSTWLNIGTAMENAGRYEEAMAAAVKALTIKERMNDERGEARVLNNISLLYWRMDRLPEAVATLRRSISIKRTADSLGLASSLNGLGVLLTEGQRYDTAIAVLHESLAWEDRLSGGFDRHIQLSNLGLAFEQAGRPDSALHYYALALDEARANEDPQVEIRALYGIGEVLIGQERYAEAAPVLDSSLALAERIGSLETIKEAHLSIARQREGVGDLRAALDHYTQHQHLRDSLMNAEKDAAMNELLVRYEVERKERENDRLRLDNERAGLRAERQQWVAIGIGVIALTVAALAWVIIQRNRNRARQREAELEQQALRLQMDPHFLFNALNTIPGLYASGDAGAANDHVGHLSKFLRLVLETSRRRTIPLALEIELVEHYLRISANRKPGMFTWQVKVMPYVRPERLAVPPMLIQPVVENALEHGLGAGKGHIDVLVDLAGSVLQVEVTDNGVGRKAAAQRPSRRNGTSMGIDLVRQRILLFDDRANISDAVLVRDEHHADGTAAGTTVTLRLRPQPLTEHAAAGDRG